MILGMSQDCRERDVVDKYMHMVDGQFQHRNLDDIVHLTFAGKRIFQFLNVLCPLRSSPFPSEPLISGNPCIDGRHMAADVSCSMMYKNFGEDSVEPLFSRCGTSPAYLAIFCF